MKFRYMLVGLDKDWIEAGTRRVAYYTNLSPGEYVFRVLACNSDGVWNLAGSQMRVRLKPHFYETKLFYIGIGLAIVALAAGLVRARIAQLRAQARALEKKVNERTAELAAALKSLEAKDKRIGEDLEQARSFQQRLLPSLPDAGVLVFGALYRPADQVGGDIYDICEIAPRTWRIFVADTTGHGVQASLRTMVLRTEYDAVKRTLEGGPSRVLERVNRRLCETYPGLELRCNAVCLDVKVDAEGNTKVTYANAAQPPLLHATNGSVNEVYERGPFLGMMDEISLVSKELALDKGDRLLVYTDGIYEQENGKGQAFGFEPMTAILGDRHLGPTEVVETLAVKLTSFAGQPQLDDDVTLICIERTDERAASSGK
jgi:serine phosphatase RsbU (regulator of sigma subunit)